jgi:hypothetical protein
MKLAKLNSIVSNECKLKLAKQLFELQIIKLGSEKFDLHSLNSPELLTAKLTHVATSLVACLFI